MNLSSKAHCGHCGFIILLTGNFLPGEYIWGFHKTPLSGWNEVVLLLAARNEPGSGIGLLLCVSLSLLLLKAWWDSLLSPDYVICPHLPVMTIRHVIYYSVFPPTWCDPFSEAFCIPLGDNILSHEFTAERLTQLQTHLSVAPHLLAKPKFRCEKGCGVLLNTKKQIQPPLQGEPTPETETGW